MNIELAVFDFDGTVGDTFTPHPTAPGIDQACRQAFTAMFGIDGESFYDGVGGLKNRSPAEITEAVIKYGGAAQLLQELRERLDAFRARLDTCVPAGKGVPLTWNEEDPYRVATEIFVRSKLQAFRIGGQPDGTIWPNPCGNVLAFIDDLRRCGVEIGILSSGHDVFIQQCFELWERTCPKLMLTDDDLRGSPVPLYDRSKPSPRLFDLLLERFGRAVSRGSIVYYGDDLVKDGQLAHNSGIRFGWYNPGKRASTQMVKSPYVIFSNWRELNIEEVV